MTGRPRRSARPRRPDPIQPAPASTPGPSVLERGRDLAGLSVAGITRRRIAILMAALLSAWIVLALSRQVGEAADAASQANQLSQANQALSAQIATLTEERTLIQEPGVHRDRGPGSRPRRPRRASLQPRARRSLAAARCARQRLRRARGPGHPDGADRRLARPPLRVGPLATRRRRSARAASSGDHLRMPERVLTAAELSRASLARQLLLEPASLDPVTAVEQLVALQAQEPASPYLALWTRLAGFKAADLHQAFHDRTVVKGTLLRVTLHVVSARDYRLYWPALAPRLRHWREPMLRQVGLGPEIEALAGQAAAFAAEPRFGTELRDHLPALTGDPGPAGQTDSWWAIRPFLPFLMAPGEPPWSFGRRPRFVAAPSWLGTELGRPRGRAAPPDRALPRRVRPGRDRRHSQVQPHPGARPAGRDGGARCRAADVSGFEGPAPVRRSGREPLPPGDTPAPVRFLPMWDSLLLAYADREQGDAGGPAAAW